MNTKIKTSGLLALSAMSASAVSLSVSQDGYIDAYGSQQEIVQGGGVSTTLQLRTPNPSGAFQYNLLPLMGFDTTGVDLSQITAATFEFTLISGTPNLTAYLLADNSGSDVFDETTLTHSLAASDLGIQRSNLLTGQRISGDIIGTQDASAGTVVFNITGAALTSLRASSNNFLTFVVQSNTPNNTAYHLGSKEGLNGAVFSYALIPEPSTSALALLSLGGLFLRRRR